MTDLIINFADQLHRDKHFTRAEQGLILATLAQVQFQMEQFRNIKPMNKSYLKTTPPLYSGKVIQ